MRGAAAELKKKCKQSRRTLWRCAVSVVVFGEVAKPGRDRCRSFLGWVGATLTDSKANRVALGDLSLPKLPFSSRKVNVGRFVLRFRLWWVLGLVWGVKHQSRIIKWYRVGSADTTCLNAVKSHSQDSKNRTRAE